MQSCWSQERATIIWRSTDSIFNSEFELSNNLKAPHPVLGPHGGGDDEVLVFEESGNVLKDIVSIFNPEF